MHGAGSQLSGRYRLDERIGGGGMGEVWRGTDEVLGRTVAIKIMLPALMDEPGFAERFRAEARTMARLKHAGIVNVYDYGTDGQTAFLVMEYIDGDPLSRTLSRVGRLTAARTMALIAQAADALEAAHAAGIVHRDVKPGNLMVRANGSLVLTDFGISRSELTGLTGSGTLLGTASYLSPEQAAGQVASPASDLYALGVVAYQCLAGRRPFEGDNPLEIAMKHVREAPPPLPADTPPAVRDIVLRTLAKEPAGRWPSAAALAAVARQAAATLGAGVVVPPPQPLSPHSPTPISPGSVGSGGYSPAPPTVGGQLVGGQLVGGSPAGGQPPIGQPAIGQPALHHPFLASGQPAGQPFPAGAPPVAGHPASPAGVAAPRQDRPSALAVAAVILFAIATVTCAGVLAYLLRQATDGQGLADLFSTIIYDHPIEGSMKI